MSLKPEEVTYIIHILSQNFLKPDVRYLSEKEAIEEGLFEDPYENDKIGWYQRLSAPGFLDCTEWSGPYPTENEANEALAEMWGDEVELPDKV